ncbi:MAG: NAD(P)H-dependent oxidoreductase [Patescibacteria group bacterium]|nr:NAD(P)H-dependent oxidoreductase [Patescibacteria group bacterium]
MNDEKLKIKIILGSTRESRMSDKFGQWIADELNKHQKVEVEILDLRSYDLPFYDEAKINEKVREFQSKVKEADGFVIIAPEYNHGPTAVLKNALDWCYEEWNYKPIAFVGYGSAGASRSIEQLRLNVIELRMIPIRNAVHILGNRYYAFRDGKLDFKELVEENLNKAHEMIHELLWLTKVMKDARQSKN